MCFTMVRNLGMSPTLASVFDTGGLLAFSPPHVTLIQLSILGIEVTQSSWNKER